MNTRDLASTGPGLPRGYATAQTDGGHPSPFGVDTSWIPNNPVAVTGFGRRAIHEMTVMGKSVIASYYGRPRQRAISRGAPPADGWASWKHSVIRMTMTAWVAGAPVHSLLTQSSTVVRDQIFKAPGAAVPAEQIKLVHEAVLSACDATDGLKDGVITDPRRCEWSRNRWHAKRERQGAVASPPLRSMR